MICDSQCLTKIYQLVISQESHFLIKLSPVNKNIGERRDSSVKYELYVINYIGVVET